MKPDNQRHQQDPKKPALIAYSVKLTDGDQAIWTRIGIAWAHRKAGGFSIDLDALPLEGRIVLLPPQDNPKSTTTNGGERSNAATGSEA